MFSYIQKLAGATNQHIQTYRTRQCVELHIRAKQVSAPHSHLKSVCNNFISPYKTLRPHFPIFLHIWDIQLHSSQTLPIPPTSSSGWREDRGSEHPPQNRLSPSAVHQLSCTALRRSAMQDYSAAAAPNCRPLTDWSLHWMRRRKKPCRPTPSLPG